MPKLLIFLVSCLFSSLLIAQTNEIGLHPVKVGEKWGYINNTGELVIEAVYDNVDVFNASGTAIVRKQDQLGVIDSRGKLLIPCAYELVQILKDELILLRKSKNWQIRNFDNELVMDQVSGHVEVIGRGYLMFETVTGMGLAHIDRGQLTEPVYKNFSFSNHPDFLLVESFEGLKGLVDSLGALRMPLEYEDLRYHGNFIAALKERKWTIWSPQAALLFEGEWKAYTIHNPNFLIVKTSNRQQLYSFSSDSMLLDDFQQIRPFADDVVMFSNAAYKFGLMHASGQILLDDKYNDILSFGDNTYRIQDKENQQWGIVNNLGEMVLPVEYDNIGPLANTVAKVSKDNLFGVVHESGSISLPPRYPNFKLDNNSFNLKDPEEGLLLFVFDDNGNIEEQTQFTNFKSIKITTNSNARRGGPRTTRTSLVREINDTLIWRRAGNGKFGVWNTKTRKYDDMPKYDNVRNYPDLGISIMEVREREAGGELSLSYLQVTMNSVFGVLSNTIGKPVTRMEFIHIEMDDITRDSLGVARCIFVGGKHGLMKPNGKVIARNLGYIDQFTEGLARCSKKGRMALVARDKVDRHLGESDQFFWNIDATYEMSGYSSGIGDFLKDYVLFCNYGEWGFVDTDGNWIIGTNYEFVEPMSNGTAMAKKEGKWGLIDAKGDVLVELKYDDMNFIPNAEKQLFYVSKEIKNYGCINQEAKVIVPPEYNKIRYFNDGMIAVRKGNRWGFMNDRGEMVVDCIYRSVQDFSEGYAAVRHKGRWGFIDKQGNWTIPPQYSSVGQFQEGKVWVRLRGAQTAYINPSNDTLFIGDYSQATEFQQGVARVRLGRKGWGLINEHGQYIKKPKRKFTRIEPFNELGLAKVKVGKRAHNLMNQEGKLLCKRNFAQIKAFSEGYAVVRRHGYGGFRLFRNVQQGLIDSTGELCVPLKFKQLSPVQSGRASFAGKDGFGFINTKGEVVIEPQYMKVNDFVNGRAVVYEAYNKSGLVDTSGNYIIRPEVNRIMEVREELALVRARYGSYYFLYEDLKRHTPYNFRDAHCFQDGIAPVCSANGGWGVINHQGLQMITPKYSDIENYENGFAKVKLYKKQGVVNVKGELVIPAEYEYVAYAGAGLFRIEQGDQMGYLNRQGEWVWPLQ